MRILVLSDSHGNVDNMARAVELTAPDRVLHLGDCQRDLTALRARFPALPMEGVPGNCDWGSCDQPERLLEIGGVRIFVLRKVMSSTEPSRDAVLIQSPSSKGFSKIMTRPPKKLLAESWAASANVRPPRPSPAMRLLSLIHI